MSHHIDVDMNFGSDEPTRDQKIDGLLQAIRFLASDLVNYLYHAQSLYHGEIEQELIERLELAIQEIDGI